MPETIATIIVITDIYLKHQFNTYDFDLVDTVKDFYGTHTRDMLELEK